jgi:hypothetical protein
MDPAHLQTHTHPLIPGAYEQNTLTHRQPGSMGGHAFGSETVRSADDWMSAALIADRRREGGGVSPNIQSKIEEWWCGSPRPQRRSHETIKA